MPKATFNFDLDPFISSRIRARYGVDLDRFAAIRKEQLQAERAALGTLAEIKDDLPPHVAQAMEKLGYRDWSFEIVPLEPGAKCLFRFIALAPEDGMLRRARYSRDIPNQVVTAGGLDPQSLRTWLKEETSHAIGLDVEAKLKV